MNPLSPEQQERLREMQERQPIVIFTAVHSAFDTAQQTFAAIDACVSEPYIHLVGDDFSPGDESEQYAALDTTLHPVDNPEGLRAVYHCSGLGVSEGPCMGLSLGFVWEFARVIEAKALWVVESDVLPHRGIIEGFREAEGIWGDNVGAVAPLYTEVGGNVVTTHGGMLEDKAVEEAMGIKGKQRLDTWDTGTPKLAKILWAHLACLWIPLRTLQEPSVLPDANMPLYYLDHDLCKQISKTGRDIIVADRCVAEHTRAGASTGVKWPDAVERERVAEIAFLEFKNKWDELN